MELSHRKAFITRAAAFGFNLSNSLIISLFSKGKKKLMTFSVAFSDSVGDGWFIDLFMVFKGGCDILSDKG